MNNSRQRRTVIAAILCAAFILVVFWYNKSQLNPNEGWKTLNEPTPPFKESIITNGRNPVNFEIEMIQPLATQAIQIKRKSSQLIEVIAQVKVLDRVSPGSDNAPTVVVARIRQGRREVSSIILKPFEKRENAYVYSGGFSGPRSSGDFRIEVEVSYSIFESLGGDGSKPVQLKPFKKTLQGASIHVSG